MKYMIAIFEHADAFALREDPDRGPAYMGSWHDYSRALAEAGVIAGGAGLMPPATATTLRLRDGQRHVQDGPYADTKEQLGGFYLIDVPDLDTALDWAARCPAAPHGAIEVRPLMPPPPQG